MQPLTKLYRKIVVSIMALLALSSVSPLIFQNEGSSSSGDDVVGDLASSVLSATRMARHVREETSPFVGPAALSSRLNRITSKESSAITGMNLGTDKAQASEGCQNVLIIGGEGLKAKLDIFPDFGFDKAITEIVNATATERDGLLFNVNTSIVPFITDNKWKGKCFYEARNFCVLNGSLTFFHNPKLSKNIEKRSLRMCNEFSKHSHTIRLKFRSHPMPEVLPAPLATRTPGWVVQYWCQDLFHMTLTMLPAYQTLLHEFPALMAGAEQQRIAIMAALGHNHSTGGEGRQDRRNLSSMTAAQRYHPDVFVHIAKGLRRKRSMHCAVKLGDPRSWDDVRNKRWNDRQFPISGNPYWPFYQIMTADPDRVYPLYHGATRKSMCYTRGIIDKYYIKDMDGAQAVQYSNAILDALRIGPSSPRTCGRYRLTLIDRRGRTRRLSNIAEIATLSCQKGFNVTPVALETMPIRKQIELMTQTDALVGVHGNGITWLQFLPPGSAVVELVGVWYTPYALLWGHRYFHSSIRNNPYYKEHGEFVPFPHNLTELSEILDKVKAHLDSVSCTGSTLGTSAPKLEQLYESCRPHC